MTKFRKVIFVSLHIFGSLKSFRIVYINDVECGAV